jgi:hypothetical protein
MSSLHFGLYDTLLFFEDSENITRESLSQQSLSLNGAENFRFYIYFLVPAVV